MNDDKIIQSNFTAKFCCCKQIFNNLQNGADKLKEMKYKPHQKHLNNKEIFNKKILLTRYYYAQI